jgi:hypothetical protein
VGIRLFVSLLKKKKRYCERLGNIFMSSLRLLCNESMVLQEESLADA